MEEVSGEERDKDEESAREVKDRINRLRKTWATQLATKRKKSRSDSDIKGDRKVPTPDPQTEIPVARARRDSK